MGSNSVTKLESSMISFGSMNFLITDRPTDATIERYIDELKKHKAQEVVRVCEPTYKTDKIEAAGIKVLDWQFDDGMAPPNEIVDQWIGLLKNRFSRTDENCKNCVAVHCVAGLGRAPLLVALALMEGGMKYEDAVELIRQKRRGAINAKQLAYLEKYRPKSRLKSKTRHKGCLVM